MKFFLAFLLLAAIIVGVFSMPSPLRPPLRGPYPRSAENRNPVVQTKLTGSETKKSEPMDKNRNLERDLAMDILANPYN